LQPALHVDDEDDDHHDRDRDCDDDDREEDEDESFEKAKQARDNLAAYLYNTTLPRQQL
jgi:hypothetical protein